jgi:hypothetical protein
MEWPGGCRSGSKNSEESHLFSNVRCIALFGMGIRANNLSVRDAVSLGADRLKLR